jgi:hypothetical protein
MNLLSTLKKITIVALAIPLSLNFSLIVRAEPPTNSGNIALKIARNPLAPDTQLPRNNSNNAACLQYVRTGLQAEEAGNESKSLEYYIQALRVDERCGYAYLFAAEHIAKFDKPTAIEFGTAAAACFAEEEDREGLEAALELLKSFGVVEF